MKRTGENSYIMSSSWLDNTKEGGAIKRVGNRQASRFAEALGNGRHEGRT